MAIHYSNIDYNEALGELYEVIYNTNKSILNHIILILMLSKKNEYVITNSYYIANILENVYEI